MSLVLEKKVKRKVINITSYCVISTTDTGLREPVPAELLRQDG